MTKEELEKLIATIDLNNISSLAIITINNNNNDKAQKVYWNMDMQNLVIIKQEIEFDIIGNFIVDNRNKLLTLKK